VDSLTRNGRTCQGWPRARMNPLRTWRKTA